MRGPQAGAEAACLGEERDLCWISTHTYARPPVQREGGGDRAREREREREKERDVNHDQVAHMHMEAHMHVEAHTGAWLLSSRKQAEDNSGM